MLTGCYYLSETFDMQESGDSLQLVKSSTLGRTFRHGLSTQIFSK